MSALNLPLVGRALALQRPFESGNLARTMQPLHYSKTWLFLGLFLLAVIALLSLAQLPAPDIQMPTHFDKYEHIAAYAVAAFYWCQLFVKQRDRLLCAFALIALSGTLELAQGFLTQHRSGDWLDLVANTIGVMIGFAACKTIFGETIMRIDQRIRLKRDL
jgi:VanZ family protein